MPENSPVQQVQKLARIWSDRRQRNIAVCIQYSFEEQGDCKIYTILKVEEFE